MNKKELLEFMLKKRNSLSKEIVLEGSKRVLLNYQKSENYFNISSNQKIACYLPINKEVDTNSLINYIKNKGNKVLLPIILENKKILEFKEHSKFFKIGKFNIKEPILTKAYFPDIILAPLVAFDKNGNRLGYGGGYYDTTLNYYKAINHKVLYIGLAYDFQEVKKIDANNFDVKLNAIITNKEYKYFDIL